MQTITNTPISSISLPEHEIIYVKESETIAMSLTTLQSKQIRTIAVLNDQDDKIQGLVSV